MDVSLAGRWDGVKTCQVVVGIGPSVVGGDRLYPIDPVAPDDYPINGLDNGDERGYRTNGNGRSAADKVRQHER